MKGFLQLALPNPQFPADLVRLPEEIFNGKLHFFFCTMKETMMQVEFTEQTA